LYVLMRMAKTIRAALDDLKTGSFSMKFDETALGFDEYLQAVGVDDWAGVESRHPTIKKE
jgi:hypothetical protein